MKRLVFVMILAGCDDSGTGGTQVDAPPGSQNTFTSLYSSYLNTCANCHAPGAPGRTSDTEQTLDFTSQTTAFTTITTGTASGLMGNFTGCNGVPFIGEGASDSLLVAVLDQPTRQAFDLPEHPDCDVDAISDETVSVKAGPPPSGFISSLQAWIAAGTPNN